MVKRKTKKVVIEGPKVSDYIKSLGLLPKGKVQTFVDSEFARLTDPKVPSDTTHTRKSVFINTNSGSGEVTYSVYYKNMYEDTKKRYQDAPSRGAWWVHRMLNEGGREKIISGIKRLLARG
jgi:hypothetical protein